MPSERQQMVPEVRQRWKQGCAMLAAGCAIVLMMCASISMTPVLKAH